MTFHKYLPFFATFAVARTDETCIASAYACTKATDETSSLLQRSVAKTARALEDHGHGLQSLQKDLAFGNQCPTQWEDSMHFDCQLYEGARWCDSSTADGEGYGWCEKSEKCDKTAIRYGGYALKGSQKWGWGDFVHFTDAQHPLKASEVCSGCGADCPSIAPTRTLNPIPEGCMDYPAANGLIWRGPSGYSCGAYHHGGFCIQDALGNWVPGTLMEGYGALTTYKNWARLGPYKTKMDPLQACCTCGGGCDCTNGWKPPVGSACVREFLYGGKAYSGCTMVDNVNGKAWCSHNEKYTSGEWSECSKCAAGWKQAPRSTCVSEFTYKGKAYSGCTMVDSMDGSTAWCAHHATYVADEWSECESCS